LDVRNRNLKLLRSVFPPFFTDLPCWLGNECWKGEPVVILVFLEVSEGDEKKPTQL
jgi:hypothetical protein